MNRCKKKGSRDMPAYLRNLQPTVKVDSRELKTVLKHILELLSLKEYEVSVQMVTNRKIREFNRIYRNKDYPTDVLSFPYLEADEILTARNEEKILGDIIISAEKAQEQAQELGQSLREELAFLMIHGVLHLTGMDHLEKKDEKKMIRKQQKIREKLKKKGIL